jgi:hypothetical protein
MEALVKGLMDLNEDFLRKHMQMCIELARSYDQIAKPHVGAVIVTPHGKILGKGKRRVIGKICFYMLKETQLAILLLPLKELYFLQLFNHA